MENTNHLTGRVFVRLIEAVEKCEPEFTYWYVRGFISFAEICTGDRNVAAAAMFLSCLTNMPPNKKAVLMTIAAYDVFERYVMPSMNLKYLPIGRLR